MASSSWPAPSPRALPGTFALLHNYLLPLLSAGKELREGNKDYQQVLLDVRRSLRRFPPGERGSQRAPDQRCREADL